MDKGYIQRLKDRLPILKEKLKEIERIHGKNSERYYIAHEHLLEQQRFIKSGIPQNTDNSIPLSVDISIENYYHL